MVSLGEGLHIHLSYQPGLTVTSSIFGISVAVTGLPKPQQHHAVIMCKFADEIRYLMRNELAHLAETLGPKTLELQLRIGLHSGKYEHILFVPIDVVLHLVSQN